MSKPSFSALDVRAMVNSIRPEVVGCKLGNIYDIIDSKTYFLKLVRNNFKRVLLLESGVRFHLTDHQLEKSAVPSNFTVKVREHIRSRRLTDVRQFGVERVVIFTFGCDENVHHLILDLVACGNVILTNHENRILCLLRTINDEGCKIGKVAVKEVYPCQAAMGPLLPEPHEFHEAVQKILERADQRRENQEEKAYEQEDLEAVRSREKARAWTKKKRPEHVAMPMYQVLHKLVPWADTGLCLSCVAAAAMSHGFNKDASCWLKDHDPPFFEECVRVLQSAAQHALERLRGASRPADLGGGIIPVLSTPGSEEAGDGEDDNDGSDDDDDDDNGKLQPGAELAAGAPAWEAPLVPGWILKRFLHGPITMGHWVNEGFTPLPPDPGHLPEASVAYPSFHSCVDEFFAQLEGRKAQVEKVRHAQGVYSKVEKVKADQSRRIEQLGAQQKTSKRFAELVECNLELVERALQTLSTMVAAHPDRRELWREVKRQQRFGNPIAQRVHSLEPSRSEIGLLLSWRSEEDNEEAEGSMPMEVVPLDLDKSVRANITSLHSQRKQTRAKASTTMAQAEHAVKQAERSAQQDMQRYEMKQSIRTVRPTWWFEQFLWFISSENNLVLAGRDAAQAELIFRRHVGPSDVLVHADVAGATTCFVRSIDGKEVPPATLREAGTAVLCRSVAWEKHMEISSWYVQMDHVSKGSVPTTGDCVFTDNGFIVRGQRRFLPPTHLEMGFTLLFHVAGEDSEQRHKGERRSRYQEALASASSKALEGASGNAAELEARSQEEVDEEAAAPNEAGESLASEPEGATAEEEEEQGAEEHEILESPEGAGEKSEESQGEAQAAAPTACEDEPGVNEGLPALPEEEEQEEAHQGGAHGAKDRGKQRLGKAEKRRLKKGVSPVTGPGSSPMASEEPAVHGADEALEFQPPPRAKAAPGPKAKAAAAPPKAGQVPPLTKSQRAKQKKIREKYGDQDEDERELMSALLGIKASKSVFGGTAAGGAGAATDGSVTRAGTGPGQRQTADGHPTQQQDQEPFGPGCDHDPAAELQPGHLDVLTGKPTPEDRVLYCMPMVAPYCSLGGPYAERVKLSPGTTKKVQAAKTCLQMLEAQMEQPAWKQLVQAIPEADAAGMLYSSSKLSMPGMQKLQSQAKRDTKKQARARG